MRRRIIHRAIGSVVTSVLAVSALVVAATPAHAVPVCQDNGVLIVYARESSAKLGESDGYRTLKDALNAELSNIPHATIEVGALEVPDYSYPATGLLGWGLDFMGYINSRNIGAFELDKFINQRVKDCPNESYVFGGTSQGADLIGVAAPSFSQEALRRTAFVALFGDPHADNLCVGSTRLAWVRGSAKCDTTGFFGPRIPYVPEELVNRTGSWCDKDDGYCSWRWVNMLPFEPLTGHLRYPDSWMAIAANEIGYKVRIFLRQREAGSSSSGSNGSGSSGSSGSISGTTYVYPRSLPSGIRNGALVGSDDGNQYVYIGGRLFWFDRNDTGQLIAMWQQAERLTGSSGLTRLHHDAVHAIEVNHAASGQYVPGANMPPDNLFLIEYGNPTQYVTKFQHPFPIGSIDELIALGGRDKGIMVGRGTIGPLRQHPPQWVDNDLYRFWDEPTVWHFASGLGYRINSIPVRDCLAVRWNRGVTLMPASAWNYLPTNPTQQAGSTSVMVSGCTGTAVAVSSWCCTASDTRFSTARSLR